MRCDGATAHRRRSSPLREHAEQAENGDGSGDDWEAQPEAIQRDAEGALTNAAPVLARVLH